MEKGGLNIQETSRIHNSHEAQHVSLPRPIAHVIIKRSIILLLKALASPSILSAQFIPAN